MPAITSRVETKPSFMGFSERHPAFISVCRSQWCSQLTTLAPTHSLAG